MTKEILLEKKPGCVTPRQAAETFRWAGSLSEKERKSEIAQTVSDLESLSGGDKQVAEWLLDVLKTEAREFETVIAYEDRLMTITQF